MEKASEDLMHEHKAILLTLSILEKISLMLTKNEEVDHSDIDQLLGFLKTFADRCHHGKEEGFLFPALEEAGIGKQNGPIGIMLEEHIKGRQLIGQMQEASSDLKTQKENFINSAVRYVTLLRNHIEKENKILFPMGDSRLTPVRQKELLKDFEQFEEQVIGKGRHEELHRPLEKLEARYL